MLRSWWASALALTARHRGLNRILYRISAQRTKPQSVQYSHICSIASNFLSSSRRFPRILDDQKQKAKKMAGLEVKDGRTGSKRWQNSTCGYRVAGCIRSKALAWWMLPPIQRGFAMDAALKSELQDWVAGMIYRRLYTHTWVAGLSSGNDILQTIHTHTHMSCRIELREWWWYCRVSVSALSASFSVSESLSLRKHTRKTQFLRFFQKQEKMRHAFS